MTRASGFGSTYRFRVPPKAESLLSVQLFVSAFVDALQGVKAGAFGAVMKIGLRMRETGSLNDSVYLSAAVGTLRELVVRQMLRDLEAALALRAGFLGVLRLVYVDRHIKKVEVIGRG